MTAYARTLAAAVVKSLRRPATQTSSPAAGTGVDVTTFEGSAIATLHVGAISGTPTLDVKLQHSSDDGATDNYADITGAAFTQVTAANKEQNIAIDIQSVKKWVRCVDTIGGGSPNITYGVTLQGLKKQGP